MALSTNLISQFVKVTNDEVDTKTETTVYGTVVVVDGIKFVKIDGSEVLTPISSTADAKENERVTVTIKDHSAIVTGNTSSPAARVEDVSENHNKITELDNVMAYRITTENLQAINATIDSLKAKVAKFSEMSAVYAEIEALQAKYATLDKVSATDIEVINAEIDNIQAKFGTFTSVTTDDLEAMNADIAILKGHSAEFTYVSSEKLTAVVADIKDLDAKKLSAEQADLKYANIDFSNVGKAAMEYFYANSGLIENVVVGDGAITGNLVGVTIKGDLIEGGTVVADKLVIKGNNGLYYKLNTDGVTTEAEQTEYNSLNGSIITANSITATKINVDDLVAFDATIGGFNITDNSLYSGVKESVDNTTRGIYMDNDGQIAFGDASNFVKFYKDADNKYKLAISAESMTFGSSQKSVETAISDIQTDIDTLETNIEKNTTSISLAATKTEVTKTLGGYYTKTEADAAITDKANQITQSVFQTYTTKEDFNGLKIGGRNLLRWTQDLRITETTDGTDGISKYKSDVGTLTATENGAKLIFDSSVNASMSVPLAFDGCVENGEEVTLSFDYRGNITSPGKFYFMQRTAPNVSNNLDALVQLVANETEWQHCVVTFANDNANVRTCYRVLLFYGNQSLTPDNWIEVKAGSLKLEVGNKATDWTPAPEDVDEKIDDTSTEIHETITEQNAAITQTCEEIILQALTSYTETGDFEEFKKTTESQLSMLSDQLTLKFTETSERLESVNGALQEQLNTITKYFTFDINGLTIGQADNPYKVVIDNDRYSMTVNDVEVMWISDGKVFTPEIEITRGFKLLGYSISQDAAGNVNCEYIGGE